MGKTWVRMYRNKSLQNDAETPLSHYRYLNAIQMQKHEKNTLRPQ